MTQALPHYKSFEHLNTQHIPSLDITVGHFRHKVTGAAHYHLASNNDENVFLVALRTVPQDSTGVAHILEHTALCGSKNYPVRDPFFMMLRRSLNTFMNAFTSSDWTAYPFASQTPKDFENLLQVYLDAVFFSNLDPLDFAQEGHRIELENSEDLNSDLVYKGVVFNEMKGAMSSVNSTLWQTLSGELFDNTYHYNSGGDPECITDLTYEQLKSFYQTHYHPSNAIFMTFGNMPADYHQQRFEDWALNRFERSDARIEVELATPFAHAKRVEHTYSLDDSDDLSGKTHIVMGWKLGESQDLMAQLEAHLITNLLLENSASPLMAKLETSSLGNAPSPLCGLEDSMREMVFCCGIAGSEPEHIEATEQLILGVLEKCAEAGFSDEDIEAVLHQLELHQREITGDGMPYGLNLILQGLSAATHYADPVKVLNLEPALAQLKDNIKTPGYVQNLIKERLLDNAHRVTLVLKPDTQLSAAKIQAEKDKLQAIKKTLSEDDLRGLVAQAKALQDRQNAQDDSSILPKVTKNDVAEHLHEPTYRNGADAAYTLYPAGTNGLIYREVVAELAQLNAQELQALPLYADFLTEVGLGSQSYLDVQKRQSASVGGIHAHAMIRGNKNQTETLEAYFALSSKALVDKSEQQLELMHDTLNSPRFDELKRLRELVSQRTQRRMNAITGNGHSLAMSAAAAAHATLATVQDQLGGLPAIAYLKALNKRVDNNDELEAFAEGLAKLHQSARTGAWQSLLIGEDQVLNSLEAAVPHAQLAKPTANLALQSSPFDPAHRKQLWLADTQVYFCAKAYATVSSDHPDAPALTVLGGLLRNGFLHRAIREQGGAYGGGASQDGGTGVFRFYSYRDPRFGDTLDDFDASITWLLSNTFTDEALDESVLGVIAALDKPASPAGACKQHFHNRLFGRTHADKESFRQSVLQCTREDILRVAQQYLNPADASIAVIAPKGADSKEAALVSELGLQPYKI